MRPYYDDGRGVQIFHGDCREVLPALTEIGAYVTDPPYGLGDRWTGGTWFTRGVYATDKVEWDVVAPQDVAERLAGAGVPTILWGGNYFALPPARCVLAWFKVNAVATMADFELAWTNLDRPAAAFSAPCGVRNRQHPTEKPLDLMTWCLSLVKADGPIVDPFMGSGTTLRAAKDLGRRAIGIEIEERYCEIAARRLSQEVLAL